MYILLYIHSSIEADRWAYLAAPRDQEMFISQNSSIAMKLNTPKSHLEVSC